MPVPVFYIFADGEDVTDRFKAGGLVSMTITDNVGLKSDTLQIVIDDADGRIAAPKTGTVLTARGGYLDGEIRNFGQFTVDQVTFSGYPQQIQIDAQSVAAASTAKQQRPKDYRKEEYPTYGDIFKEVAGRAGLSLSISSEVASIKVEYEAQGEEKELEFAARLGRKLDAFVSIKSGRMFVAPRGSGLSASGQQMPTIVVARGVNLLDYSATWMDKPKHSTVKATWYDRKKNKQETVEESTDMDGPDYLIREPYQTEEEAKQAAKTKAGQLKRAQANASFSIDGAPSASAGAFVICSNTRPGVDGAWYAKTVTHNFLSSGPYTTSLDCEVPSKGARKSGDSKSPGASGGSSGSSGGGAGGNGGNGSTGTNSGGSAPETPTAPPFKPWSRIDLA